MRSASKPRLRSRARLDIVAGVALVSMLLVVTKLGDLSLDTRSLSAARICLGALVFVDFWTSRWPLRHLFYCDGPLCIWPRDVVSKGGDPQVPPSAFSVYSLSGSVHLNSCMMMFGGSVASVLLSVGLQTHVACFICWVHVYSLSTRSSSVQQAGDTLLRLLLFWFMWLPCHSHFSLDAYLSSLSSSSSSSSSLSSSLSSSVSQPTSVLSVASVALLVQMSLLYQLPAAFKINALWMSPTESASAIYYVLANVAFRRVNFVSTWLAGHPETTYLLTLTTPYLEHFAPIFIFGSRVPWLRTVGVVTMVSFHAGLHVCMTLRLFPWICMAAWVALMPSGVWDGIIATTVTATATATATAAVWSCDQSDDMCSSDTGSCTRSGSINIEQELVSGSSSSSGGGGGYSPYFHFGTSALCVAALACTVQACLDCLPLLDMRMQLLGVRTSIGDGSGGGDGSSTTASTRRTGLALGGKLWSLTSRVGRVLGVHQQWFLFDNPAKTSYWYLVRGSLSAGAATKRRDKGKEEEGMEYDLHNLLRFHCEGKCHTLSPRSLAEYITCKASSTGAGSGFSVGDDFEALYGGALWRKFLQNMGQQEQSARYAAFLPHYITCLREVWEETGLRAELGELGEVKCVACWVDKSPAALTASPEKVNKTIMWKLSTSVK